MKGEEDPPRRAGIGTGEEKRRHNYWTGEASEILKGLEACRSVGERNLLADTSKIADKNKMYKRKDNFCRKIVTEGLLVLGYDASICKSRWEKSPYYPADHMAGN